MKKLLYLLLLTTFGANAQSISNQVISSYGLSADNGTAQTDVTIGEPITATISDGNNTLTQGFHQTKLIVTSIRETEANNDYNFYPNPVTETLSFTNTNNEHINVQLFDANGKQLWSKLHFVGNQEIDLKNNAPGIYLLKVTDTKNNELKTVKVIKL